MQAKLSPTGTAKINFPGFQRITNFVSTGGDTSHSITINSDTDAEYLIYAVNLNTSSAAGILVRYNADTTAANYGYQMIQNTAGTITAARDTRSYIFYVPYQGESVVTALCASGALKTVAQTRVFHSSATTVGAIRVVGAAYNTTGAITTLSFVSESGNFATGSTVAVYARRSQT